MGYLKAMVFTVQEDEIITCHYCEKQEEHLKAIQTDWNVYVFHDRHECPACRDKLNP